MGDFAVIFGVIPFAGDQAPSMFEISDLHEPKSNGKKQPGADQQEHEEISPHPAVDPGYPFRETHTILEWLMAHSLD